MMLLDSDRKFKRLAKEIKPVLKKDFGISLNFAGYNETIDAFKRIDSIDLYSMYELVKDASEWSLYFADLRSLLLYYEDIIKIRVDIYEHLLHIHKEDMKSKDKKNKKLTQELKIKYKILKSSDTDIFKELNTKIRTEKKKYRKIKEFNKVLLSRIKLFESIYYTVFNAYNKGFYELHFKGGIY